MRIPRFYLPQPLLLEQPFELPAPLFRHAIQVLKLRLHEPLILFNGQGGEYQGTLTQVEKRRALCTLTQFDPIERESPLRLKLVQAVIKPDKMDWALQKSVELGITEIQPLQSQRTVIRLDSQKLKKKQEHWQAVVNSACEQSGRTRPPMVHPLLTLADYLQQRPPSSHEQRIILDPSVSSQALSQVLCGTLPETSSDEPDITSHVMDKDKLRYSLLIGPEGGFTADEVIHSQQAGCLPASLGPRILRAETASASAITLLQYSLGDLG